MSVCIHDKYGYIVLYMSMTGRSAHGHYCRLDTKQDS